MLLSRSQTMRPSRRFLRTKTGLLVGAVAVLYAQAPGSGPVPDDVLYWSVFHHIQDRNAVADRLLSEKKDDRPARASLKNQTGLSDAEWVQLQAITADFLSVEKVFNANRTAALSSPVGPERAARLQQLDAGYMQSKLDHIQQLKTALGEARFKLLDDWARKYVLPETGYIKGGK